MWRREREEDQRRNKTKKRQNGKQTNKRLLIQNVEKDRTRLSKKGKKRIVGSQRTGETKKERFTGKNKEGDVIVDYTQLMESCKE